MLVTEDKCLITLYRPLRIYRTSGILSFRDAKPFPCGIETSARSARHHTSYRLNGLWSPFGIETSLLSQMHSSGRRLNGLGFPSGIETRMVPYPRPCLYKVATA